MLTFIVVASKLLTGMNCTPCVKAYPTITNAHHGVGFARVIYVPKRTYAFRRIDSQDLVKFNNRDASASARSSGGFNCGDDLSPELADSLAAIKVDESEHSLTVDFALEYVHLSMHFDSPPSARLENLRFFATRLCLMARKFDAAQRTFATEALPLRVDDEYMTGRRWSHTTQLLSNRYSYWTNLIL
jgi:hypothetical protein